jgi:hypothetical protein
MAQGYVAGDCLIASIANSQECTGRKPNTDLQPSVTLLMGYGYHIVFQESE